jgi:hypothetical protein
MPKQITTMPARQFARDLAGAKRAADLGPVLLTDRGHPACALLRIDGFYDLCGKRQPSRSLLELMHGLPDTAGMDVEPPCLIDQPTPADLD